MKKSEVADPAYAKGITDAFDAGVLNERNRIISVIESLEKDIPYTSLGSCVWTRQVIKAINDDVQ